MRDQPRQFLDFLVGRERKDETGTADRLHFDGLGDFDPAHVPVHPAFSSSFSCSGKDAGFHVPVQWII
jgi:hypothetical protein